MAKGKKPDVETVFMMYNYILLLCCIWPISARDQYVCMVKCVQSKMFHNYILMALAKSFILGNIF